MTRLNLVLLLAVVVSALYLVQISYESRRQFIALERERNQAQELDRDAEKLRVLLRTQATHLRVEQLAQDRLHMRVATPAVSQYLNADGTVAAASAPVLSAASAGRKPGGRP